MTVSDGFDTHLRRVRRYSGGRTQGEDFMRVSIWIHGAGPLLAASLLCAPASAQNWIEHVDPAWGYSINFPHVPEVQVIEYPNMYERIVPAQVASATTDIGTYTLTLVSYSSDPTDAHTAISHAARFIRAKGTVTYNEFQQLDEVPGQVISVTTPEGNLIQAGLYFVEQRLYVAEGMVRAGNPPPSNFQQSISLLDPLGNRIIHGVD